MFFAISIGKATWRRPPPEIRGEPVEPEVLERLRERLARLRVVANLGVPGGHHLLPLLADRLALGGAVVGRGAIAERGPLAVGADAAAEPHGAEDRRRP